MSTRTVTVIICRIGSAPVVEEIADTLEASQSIVGGYVDAIGLQADEAGTVFVIFNEEGQLQQLGANRAIHSRAGQRFLLVGDFYIGRADRRGDNQSLTPADLAHYLPLLTLPVVG